MTEQLLNAGHRVAATSRTLDGLREAAGPSGDNFLPLEVDLVDEASVDRAIQATVATFGRLDFVVNNAGYGQLGSLEELSDGESRTNFDVNVFGTLNVIRSAMPQLRKQAAGHIVNFSSIAGLNGSFPGWGIYCATKFAVEGLSESLAEEVSPFGVRVTIVEPGYFRTDFLSDQSLNLPANKLAEYATVRESEAFHTAQMKGQQPGDPVKAVAAVIEAVTSDRPPLRLLLGEDAYTMARKKIESLNRDMEAWKEITLSTGFAG